jgi:proteasome assembly chaperone (PAC2) family protein
MAREREKLRKRNGETEKLRKKTKESERMMKKKEGWRKTEEADQIK